MISPGKDAMKCNSCWRTLEGRAIATTCGHVFCPEDASKILTSDSTCPMCEQILSKSNMKAVELTPGDDWVNMVMAGTPPQSIMKSAYKGVMFWIGQKEVEAQITVSKAMHLKQKYEEMQQKYMEKLEQIHGAYQKAMKKVQFLEHEKENLLKDKTELQEKYTEKSRQKRKLEEMYDALRNEYEQLKRGGLAPIQKERVLVQARPAQYNSFAPNPRGYDEPKSRGGASGLFDIPGLPAPRSRGGQQSPAGSGGLPSRPHHTSAAGSPFKLADPNPMFTPAGGNASAALRNLLLSPMRKQNSTRMRSGLSR